MKQYTCLLALLCLAFSSCAQSQQTNKPLQVGDTIPHIILTDVVNFPVSQIQLSSYKGKLLILDFWATWCNSCVHNFPKLDSLQTRFAEKLQFVLINNLITSGNTNDQVKSFFTNRTNMAKAVRNIPVCTDSTMRFKQLFPYKFIPHYVWIGPSGKIIAITGSKDLTVTNIRKAIQGKPLLLPVKKE